MSQNLRHQRLAYTVKEASELLSLSRAHLYRLLDLGLIASIHIGRARRITATQIDSFLGEQERTGGLASLRPD